MDDHQKCLRVGAHPIIGGFHDCLRRENHIIGMHGGWLYLQNAKHETIFYSQNAIQREDSEGCTPFVWKSGSSVDHPVLSDHVMFLERRGVRRPRNRLGSEDVLFEEALLDELFQVSSEGPAMDGLVPLAVVVGAVLRPGQ